MTDGMKRLAMMVAVLAPIEIANAFSCPANSRRPVIEVWSASLGSQASFLWCVRGNELGMLPGRYAEFLRGLGLCHGRGCPLHRGPLSGEIMTADPMSISISPLPRGVLMFSASWFKRPLVGAARRCLLTGKTQPDPPLVGGPPYVGRVGGMIIGQVTCRRLGGRPRLNIPLTLTRIE